MPEEMQDPANTQMFRAFVERGEQDAEPGSRLPQILIAAAIAVVIVVLGIIFLL